jgi:transposase InsO family protein
MVDSRDSPPPRVQVDDDGDKTPVGSPKFSPKSGGDLGAGGSNQMILGAPNQVIVERVVKEAGAAIVYPELTKTNYTEWALVMQVNFEAQGLWDALELDNVPRRDDRMALAALLRAVPSKMRATLAKKRTAKEAWKSIETMRQGVERVKVANAQKLLREFENIRFKEGEAVDDFAIRISGLATNIRELGESLEEVRVVKKMLRVVPSAYRQTAISIETFLDLNTLSLEELVGRLRVSEDRLEDDEPIVDKAGRLMLSEETWLAKHRHRLTPEFSGSGDRQGGQHSREKNSAQQPREKHGEHHSGGKTKGGARPDGRDTGVKLTSEGTPRRKGQCRNCGIWGHWAQDCKRPKRERRQEAHLAKADVEQPPVMMMATTAVQAVTAPRDVQLNEAKVVPVQEEDAAVWYLDTGASNHMTGQRAALVHLDDTVHGSVRFGDGSTVDICGLGSVVIEGRRQEHKVLTDVYYIPKLKSNIISLGQLEERGCRVVMDEGVLSVQDREGTMLLRAPRTANRTYVIRLNVGAPICLLSKSNDPAWLWHTRYGHLNFRALRELGLKKMAEGIPVIDRVEQICDGCLIGKQHRTPFPRATSYRAQRGLELVHADLCGQISPPTPGGKQYFLLMVDDFSRFMWIELLTTKDQALSYIKKVKASAENEIGGKLKALRTDRGGEFNSNLFTVFCNDSGIKHYTTTPYSPQQNGVVERRNQTVVEMARCMLKSKGMPARLWGEAVVTAVYVLNRAPTKSLEGKTP